MISYIKGILVSMTPGGAVVENNGIGYDIMMRPDRSFREASDRKSGSIPTCM